MSSQLDYRTFENHLRTGVQLTIGERQQARALALRVLLRLVSARLIHHHPARQWLIDDLDPIIIG